MWLDGDIMQGNSNGSELYLQNMFSALFIILGFIYTIYFPHI